MCQKSGFVVRKIERKRKGERERKKRNISVAMLNDDNSFWFMSLHLAAVVARRYRPLFFLSFFLSLETPFRQFFFYLETVRLYDMF